MADISRLPAPVAETWDWQLHGSCRGMDSALFFHPERERGASRIDRDEKAKAVCRRCPVLVQCRQHALAAREPYGVWGAMTESERQQVLAHRARGAAA